ncbi:MAG: hypothetical protein ABJ275_06250 [Maricaulaceae bacterium]
MFGIIASGGFAVFGVPINPALFAFLLIAVIFGGLNYLDFKRFD